MAKSYTEKLRDPRWQKKRLQILERDDWCCQQCFDGASTLHVHHRSYRRGAEPWDYDDAVLLTLCETCHKEESTKRKAAEDRLIAALRVHFLTAQVDTLAAAFEAMEQYHMDDVRMAAIARTISNPDALVAAVGAYLGSLNRRRTALAGKE